MSRTRMMIAALVALTVAGLMFWQHRRTVIITGCVEGGGMWTGSACKADPNRIILQRDLHRS